MKRELSSRSRGFWKFATSSSLRVVGDGSATEVSSRLTRLVEGAIVTETPRGGLQNDACANL